MASDADSPEGGRPRPWDRVVGSLDEVGWWMVPAFLAVGLAGAVMAGALAVVYYSQQVAGLEAETRAGRQDLQGAVDNVNRASDDALEAIRSEVEAVERSLSQDLPVEEVRALGLVVVEARVNAPPPAGSTQPQPAPAGDEDRHGAPAAVAQESPSPTPSPSPTSEPPPPEPPPIQPRLGVGFAVATEGGATFVATSFELVADPGARAGVVEEVVVTTMDGDRVTGTVHSWDEERGIALLRVGIDRIEIGTWRPRGEELAPGDRVAVVGLTPEQEPVQVEGKVALGREDALLTSLPDAEFLRGSPIVDRTGRIVAVYTPGYQPFGPAAGEQQAMAPVGLYCDRMLTGCEALEGEATDPADEPTG